MKIGFVLDDSLDRPDGVQQYVLTIGRWMAQQGHEVHYLTSATTRSDVAHIHSLANAFTVCFNKNRLAIPLPTRRRNVKRLLRQLELDILHVQLPYSPLLAGRILSAASHETIVGTFHIVPATWLARLGTRLLGRLQRKTLVRFHDIVACSEPARQFAKRYYGVESEVVPNCVDLGYFLVRRPKGHKSKRLRIVFIGRLVERKGCQYLLEAVHELKHRTGVPSFDVLIAGTGPLEQSLRRYTANNDLKNVRFLGFIDETQKPRLLADADIAVFPATGGESFGIVLIEAMAAGAGVVIGGQNEGYSAVLEHNQSVLVNPTDTAQFANRLARLLSGALERDRLHRWQQTLVKQYDVAVVGAILMGRYERAIAKRASTRHN